MFANRFTAFIDACSLAGALRRNLLLTLAEAEFYRLRWSAQVLAETEAAIEKMLLAKGAADAGTRAAKARRAMETAFEDAMVEGFDELLSVGAFLPDSEDAHVLAAALKTRAAMIVTENLRDFPPDALERLNIEVRSSDAFIADTVALDPGKAVAAIRAMRLRLKKPEKTAEMLLLDMEATGLVETADALRPHILSL